MTGNRRRRPELDGIRGIAVLLVMACHAWIPPFINTGGVLGVTLFFVLSGYLITGILVREIEATGRLRLTAFYARRAWRLMPALAVLVLVWTWLTVLRGQRLDLLGVVAALGYFSDYIQAFGHQVMLDHTWSLGVEEQFYLLWPLLLLLLVRFRRHWQLVAVLAAVLLGWREVVFHHGSVTYAYRAFDTNAFALLAGCALALSKRRLPGWCGLVGIVGLAWLAVHPYNGWSAWVPGVGAACGVLLIGGCAGWGRVTPSPLRWTGRISYSLYLWHAVIFPAFFIAVQPAWQKGLIIALAFAAASASYYLIEQPFLAYRDRSRRRHETRSTSSQTVSSAGPSSPILTPANAITHN